MNDAVESHQSGILLLKIENVTGNILYFAPLQFSRQEWSVAPSIFNIKAQELAHYNVWVKLRR